ncbi:hypothetical protein WN943_025472 [Citrus x changshan-huyou]
MDAAEQADNHQTCWIKLNGNSDLGFGAWNDQATGFDYSSSSLSTASTADCRVVIYAAAA